MSTGDAGPVWRMKGLWVSMWCRHCGRRQRVWQPVALWDSARRTSYTCKHCGHQNTGPANVLGRRPL